MRKNSRKNNAIKFIFRFCISANPALLHHGVFELFQKYLLIHCLFYFLFVQFFSPVLLSSSPLDTKRKSDRIAIMRWIFLASAMVVLYLIPYAALADNAFHDWKKSAGIYADPHSGSYDPEKAYELYLQTYADHYIRFERDTDKCVERINLAIHRLAKNDIEKKSLSRIIEMCRMQPQELKLLAENYESSNPALAKSIYYNLYFKHKQQFALQKLKALGENVVLDSSGKNEH